MLGRHIERTILESLRHFPAVLLVGARQVGKSTLAQALAGGPWPARYVTLDERTVLDAALKNPDGFVQSLAAPVVLDEVQRAPDLLRAVKLVVDRQRAPGRFLLTGSANVLTLSTVAETLAGRVAVHELHPFSWTEWQARPASRIIDQLFAAESAAALLADLRRTSSVERTNEVRRFIVSGGFPTPALMESAAARRTWFDSYRQTYVERDLRDLANIVNLPDFGRLMTTLALRTAQLLNVAELSRDVGLPTTTLRRYMHLLAQTFQVAALPPYAANVAKRLVKTPKVYLSDTGMAGHLAAADTWDTIERRHFVGALVETWVHAELRKLLALGAARTELTFWRTRTGHEVDFLLERGRTVVGIEVKWSSTIERRDLTGLESCRTLLRRRWHLGVLLHGGTEAVALDDRTVAVPFGVFFGRDA
jgi:hypothetical protein